MKEYKAKILTQLGSLSDRFLHLHNNVLSTNNISFEDKDEFTSLILEIHNGLLITILEAETETKKTDQVMTKYSDYLLFLSNLATQLETTLNENKYND